MVADEEDENPPINLFNPLVHFDELDPGQTASPAGELVEDRARLGLPQPLTDKGWSKITGFEVPKIQRGQWL